MKKLLTLAAIMVALGLVGQNAFAQVQLKQFGINLPGTTTNGQLPDDLQDATSGEEYEMEDSGGTSQYTLDSAAQFNFKVGLSSNTDGFELNDFSLILNTNEFNVTLNGAIANASGTNTGALQKNGIGSLTLGGTVDVDSLVIDAGVLNLNTAATIAETTVSGGMLNVNVDGTVLGATNVNGGTLSIWADTTADTAVGVGGYLYIDNGATHTGNVTLGSDGILFGADGTILGDLTLDADSLFIIGVYQNPAYGITVGNGSGNTITVDSAANIALLFEDFGNTDLTNGVQIGGGTGDVWSDTNDATASLQGNWFNPFYGVTAVNNGNIAFLNFNALARAKMVELYAMGSQLHHYRTVLDATNNRMTQNFANEYWKPYSGCGTDCGDSGCGGKGCGTACGKSGFNFGNSVWVNYVGRQNNSMYSKYLGRDLEFTSNGVQLGVDLYTTKCYQIGVMFGYEDQTLEGFGNSLDAEDFYFGIYGARRFNCGWDIRGALGYGNQSFDLVRTAGSRFTADYDSNTFEMNMELGRRINIGRRTSIRPVFGLDFYNYDADSAAEVGFDLDRVDYAGLSLTQLYGRFGSDLQYNCGRLNINGGAYYSHQLNSDGDVSRAVVTNGIHQAMTDYQLGKSIVSLNVGAEYFLNQTRTLSLYGGYGADLYTDRDGDPVLHNGHVGTQWRF